MVLLSSFFWPILRYLEVLNISFTVFGENSRNYWCQYGKILMLSIAPYFHGNRIYVKVIPFNPFVLNAPFLYPLKTSENRTVFWCFQGVKKGRIGNEWFKGFCRLTWLDLGLFVFSRLCCNLSGAVHREIFAVFRYMGNIKQSFRPSIYRLSRYLYKFNPNLR